VAKTAANEEPAVAPVDRPQTPQVAPVRDTLPPSKQPAQRLYPRLDPQDDGFDYFDTPTKPKSNVMPPKTPGNDFFDWEESEDEGVYKKHIGVDRHVSPVKRQRFDDIDTMADLEFSPLSSPVHKKPALGNPFTTPPKQITATPHTPPETRPVPTTSLNPLSYSLLQQLSPHASTLGRSLMASLKDHLMKCGRVADGAVKGRDAARTEIKRLKITIEEFETRVRILEAQREVDRAVIGALKRNVDVLTGKVKRTD
jgi:hypothetical protein